MQALVFNQALMFNRGHALMQKMQQYAPYVLIAVLTFMVSIGLSFAAGTLDASSAGQALSGAYSAVNDLTGGYGKALVMVIGFIVTVFSILATQATGPVLKFIGIAIFLSMGLGAALTLSGAQI